MKSAAKNHQPRSADALFGGTGELATIGDWLRWAIGAYERSGAALGQIAAEAHDEVLYLLLRTFDLPLDSKSAVLKRRLTAEETRLIKTIFHRRLVDRVPAAYLTQEAWLGGHRFYVDERVIIPRSYFLELIGDPLNSLLPAGKSNQQVARVVDVCTGSGCLAILLAHHFPGAAVDGIDLSPGALEVATVNVREHGLADRVTLHHSDVFDAVPEAIYDVIVSNPPYEPSAICDDLPAEFQREPRMALDGGPDGLVIIRKLLRQAKTRLAQNGILLIEVGELQAAMASAWPRLKLRWLETADGSDCVCLIRAADLRRTEI